MKSKKLGQLTTKIGSGITPRGGSRIYVDEGTYLIRSQNIYNDHFEKQGLVCITDQIAEQIETDLISDPSTCAGRTQSRMDHQYATEMIPILFSSSSASRVSLYR